MDDKRICQAFDWKRECKGDDTFDSSEGFKIFFKGIYYLHGAKPLEPTEFNRYNLTDS